MATKAPTPASATATARLLVEVADADTVYRDVYLRRAHALLAPDLSAEQYRGLRGVQQQIDETVAKSRSATILQDWKLVQELASRAESLRRGAQAQAALVVIGELTYDAPTIAIDPFSPGMAAALKSGVDLADLRDKTLATLDELVKVDAGEAAFYASRRAYLATLVLAARRSEEAGKKTEAPREIAELERLAYDAANRGDVAELNRLSTEILARQAGEQTKKPEEKSAAEIPVPPTAMDGCPVDLGASFAADVVGRARALGFAVATTQPQPDAGPVLEYVAARVSQPGLRESESEHEGAMRIEALVEKHDYPANVAEHVKVLIAQFVRHTFVSSGGARYRPGFAAEAVLVEDFAEGGEPPVDGSILKALGLTGRRGLARDDIETALLANGARILAELGLDPKEHRLVCVPPDVYTRFGRDAGWGKQQQWTHLDGYQVLKGGKLRALVGGNARYGGLNDLTSIAPSDRRDSVVTRFAIVRRARMVARWR
ncbi:MAG: hypothetical protein IT293_07865 [Deltaproteobacteria bacterium]|nr:hypothetical protein [Deltaproteobacteria bacterium]